MHWKTCITRNFVQTLTTVNSFLHCIVVLKYSVLCNSQIIVRTQKKSKCWLKVIIIEKINVIPVRVGLTPLAKQSPPKRLLNIWFCSKVAVALLVISTPAARPSNILFFLNTGWLWVLIRTPAWAFRKMSFSSRIPESQYNKIRFNFIVWGKNKSNFSWH